MEQNNFKNYKKVMATTKNAFEDINYLTQNFGLIRKYYYN